MRESGSIATRRTASANDAALGSNLSSGFAARRMAEPPAYTSNRMTNGISPKMIICPRLGR